MKKEEIKVNVIRTMTYKEVKNLLQIMKNLHSNKIDIESTGDINLISGKGYYYLGG